MRQVFTWTISRCGSKLRGKVHARKARGIGKVGQAYGLLKILLHVIFNAPEPPLCQGIDLRLGALRLGDMHSQSLRDAARESTVDAMTLFDQSPGELFGKLTSQKHEII